MLHPDVDCAVGPPSSALGMPSPEDAAPSTLMFPPERPRASAQPVRGLDFSQSCACSGRDSDARCKVRSKPLLQ